MMTLKLFIQFIGQEVNCCLWGACTKSKDEYYCAKQGGIVVDSCQVCK
ncbi:hypothetical protein Desti_1876 [Desulfomonile tiedjei DSM 6799]|uniref:Uncharacterized protein n=1 Tax=Desulfomonile tiedjei (strain ATCC 49306 / DSM 6799 / DCB-1) TaxID=706587 RepID=I4C4U3_DESTA|nr:hypothetical protein Desti_1876 [Desulfomonile tiedjei DSM 6799]